MCGAARTTRRLPGRFAPGVALLGMLLLAGPTGCNSDSRYEVLSFFFDGVPDPNAPETSQTAITLRAGRRGVTFYVHKPYADGDCAECHKSEIPTARGTVPQDICQECHEDFSRRHAVLHGPVALNACNLCHNPHQTTVPGLLLKPPLELCTQCHLPRDMNLTVPEHRDLKTSCTNCHDPHGGEDHKFLKQNAERSMQNDESQSSGNQSSIQHSTFSIQQGGGP